MSEDLDEITQPGEEQTPGSQDQDRQLFHSLGDDVEFTQEMDAVERPEPAARNPSSAAHQDLPFDVLSDSALSQAPRQDAGQTEARPIFEDTDAELLDIFALEHDIEQALASFDLHEMEPLEEELDLEDILEFDDLTGFIHEVEEPDHQLGVTGVDPFKVSGMFMLKDASPIDDLTRTMGAEEDEEMILDPLAMSGFELIEDHELHDIEALYPPIDDEEEDAPEEITFIDSGIFELDEDPHADSLSLRRVLPAEPPPSPPDEHRLRVGLEAMGGRIELREPWARWAAELRLEVMEEPDLRKRGAYIYLFSTMLRLHGDAGRQSAEHLEAASSEELLSLRGPTFLQLAQQWHGALPRFLERFDLLCEQDRRLKLDDLDARHASILVARLVEELLRGKPSAILGERIAGELTIGALAAQALLSHRRGDRVTAASFWRELAHYLEGSEREQILTLAGYLTQEHASFFERLSPDASPPESIPRILLTSIRYGACWKGDHVLEAQAIEHLLDMEEGDGSPEMAASLHRLAMLRGMVEKLPSQLGEALALDAASAAASAAPEALIHWLVVERNARRTQDDGALILSLTEQVRLCDDATLRALAREQLAQAIARRDGEWSEPARAQLERALQESSDCLPALLTLGQERVQDEDWGGVMHLRAAPSVGESQSLNPAWRRADLLERVGGDVREALALYRSARHEHPDSVHLFLSIERSLARLGQWRGLVNLFDSTLRQQPEFSALLEQSGFDLHASQFAVEIYLEEVHPAGAERLEEHDARHGVFLPAGEDASLEDLDEPVFWRLIASRIQQQRYEEVEAQLELIIGLSAPANPELELRAQLWKIYLVGLKLRDAPRCQGALTRVFSLAQSPSLLRFAFHGLLRLSEERWVADALLEQPERGELLLDALRHPEANRPSTLRLFAAELYQRSGDAARAQELMAQHAHAAQPEGQNFARQRQLTFALHAREWERVHQLLGLIPGSHETLRAQLNVCRDLPELPDTLSAQQLDAASRDPLLGVSLLEAALRTKDWRFASALANAMVSVWAPSRSTFSSFARAIAILISEWVQHDHEATLAHASSWSEMGLDGGELEILMMLSAWYRSARRLGRDEVADEIAETVRELFNDATVALLEQELPLYRRSPEEIASWYRDQSERASGPTRAYLRASAAIIPWLIGLRDHKSTRALADTTGLADDALHLVDFFCALAHRAGAQHASAERYLATLVKQREVVELAQWAGVRALFHLATTQDYPEDALRQIAEAEDASSSAPWLDTWRAMLLRAMRRPQAAHLLQVRDDLPGQREAVELERAELLGEHDVIVGLAERFIPGAMLLAEVRAATERRDWRQRCNMELRYVGLRQSLVNDSQDIVRSRFLDYASELEPAVFASPWGPMRLVDHDLARLALPARGYDAILEGLAASHQGIASAMRLGIARQLLRLGEPERACALFPEHLGDDLTSLAWFWLGHTLLDATHEEMSRHDLQARLMEHWLLRATRARSTTRAEILYEVARAVEINGDTPRARDLYEEILTEHPDFTPAEIALSRSLLLFKDWKGVVAVWERALERTTSPQEQVGLAFRIGFVYERRLGELPSAHSRALEAYSRVVHLKPGHLPALHAMVRLANQSGRPDIAGDCLEQLLPLCHDRGLKAAYHLELAALHEQELGAPRQALRHYMDAHFLDPHSFVALQGTLRTDAHEEREHAVDVLTERLDVASSQEVAALGDLLFLLSEISPRAEYMMRQRFGDHVVWRLVQFVDGIEHGELHEEALAVISSVIEEPQLREVFMLLERAHNSMDRREHGLEELAKWMGLRPSAEGLMLEATARAWKERDLESLATLAHLGARRAPGALEMVTEMTRASMLLRWLGTPIEALELCERSLERAPDFLPAVKLARSLAAEISRWPSVARWSAREADLTRVEAIAMRARVEASEIQRRHMGDPDAAVAQLQLVLLNKPDHEEAFEHLKALFVQSQRVREALELCEQRMTFIQDRSRRLLLLNEMADLALNHLQDQDVAIRYLAASISLEPRQLRRLRILAELYDARHQHQQALACYDAATRICKDARLNTRMLLQMGHILERHLNRLDHAGNVYARILQLDSDNPQAIDALVRVKRGHGDVAGALDGLARMERLAKTPDELKRVRILRLEVIEQGNLPGEVLLNAARDVMVRHPSHMGAADILRERLKRAGRAEEIEPMFRQLLLDGLREHTTPPLGPYFSLAQRLQLNDLAYCLAGCGRWLRMASRDMMSFHESARHAQNWPSEPLPPELTAGLLPSEMSVAFFEIIRRTQEGVLDACEPVPYSQFIKRRARVSSPSSRAEELAWRWPTIFGLEARDVHHVERLPLGSAIVWDDGVRLLLDRSWQRPDVDVEQLLVRLGTQLAAWSMGIGYWSALGREAQVSLFAETIASVSPSWAAPPRPKFPSWFSRERWSRWLVRTGSDRVAPYALELASRMGPRAVPLQFLSLELAMERLACVIMPDPGASLAHTVRFGVENGPEHRPWTFVLEANVASLRRALGIALE